MLRKFSGGQGPVATERLPTPRRTSERPSQTYRGQTDVLWLMHVLLAASINGRITQADPRAGPMLAPRLAVGAQEGAHPRHTGGITISESPAVIPM